MNNNFNIMQAWELPLIKLSTKKALIYTVYKQLQENKWNNLTPLLP